MEGKILSIVANLSTPLALSGLCIAIFFFILKQILNKVSSSDIVKSIINKLFVLSLIAMFFGFSGYIVQWIPTNSAIIVRVFDNENSFPISGAKISLVVEGNIYRETTDTTGLAKLNVPFLNDKIDGRISILAKDYSIQDEQVTLLPKKCYDIRLSKFKILSIVPSDMPEIVDSKSRSSLSTNPISSYIKPLKGYRRIKDTNGIIKCGQTLLGDINTIGETNEIKFNARNGERVAVSLLNLGISALFNPIFELLDPSGNRMDWKREGNHTFTLRIDGLYTIKVFDEGNDGIGEYNIRLEPVSGYLNGVLNCAHPIECGKTLQAELASKKASDGYRFFAKDGERIAIALSKLDIEKPSASFNPAFELLDISGNRIDWKREGNHTFTLKSDGVYTIRVLDEGEDGKGTYSIRLEPVSGYFNGAVNCSPIINCDEPVQAMLESKNACDAYRFNGDHGRIVTITLTKIGHSPLFNPFFELLDVSGNRIDWKREGNPNPFTLHQQGLYTIRVCDEGSDGYDKYRLTLKGSCSR